MTIDIRKDGALIDGFKPEYYWCLGGCCSGDTPTPPEPPGPDTGTVISSITIVVADVITDSGKASAIYLPTSADILLVYSSSDENLATIDRNTGEITVNESGYVTFCVQDLYSGLEDCKLVEVIKREEPGPDTGITGITIIVADEITDSGFASAIFEPSYEETSLYYTSSDPSYAAINPLTGEITVYQDGVVIFCVKDLLSGLQDCKEVNVKKSVEPGPEPPGPDTGTTGCTDEYRIKVVYDVKTTTGYTILCNDITSYYFNGAPVIYKNWVSKFELEDGTDITSMVKEEYIYETKSKHLCYNFNRTGEVVLYLTTSLSHLGYSFYHTPDLVSVEIPCNIDIIGTGTFESCNSLKDIVVYSYDTQIIGDIITLPQTGFTSFTFTGIVERRSLTSDEIKEAYGDMKNTGNNKRFYTFEQMLCYASGIEKIYGPSATNDNKLLIADDGTLVAAVTKGLVECDIPSGVTRIGTMAFQDCTTLERVTIPDTVESIGWGAFSGCTSLHNVVIPDSVEDIAEDAFAYCTSLTGITLGNNIRNIAHRCFNGCSSLVSITIPDSVTGFGITMEELVPVNRHNPEVQQVFDGCIGLGSAVLGSGITQIADSFSDCSSFVSITCKSETAPVLSQYALNGIRNNNGILYYPEGSDYSSWLNKLTTWTGQEINDI